MYSVKELSEMAGVTPRTLHHYHHIGLLIPAKIASNGYRFYDETSLIRLQQILFYREIGLDLAQIKRILEDDDFDLAIALRTHRLALEEKIDRLKVLVRTVDSTLIHMTGEIQMEHQRLFEGFSPEEEKKYEEQATALWGESVTQSTKLWNSYSDRKKKDIMVEGKAIYQEIADNMHLGAGSFVVQSALSRWHQHMRYFFEPSLEVLRGLGEIYYVNPDFNATFTAIHPDLSAFLKQAVGVYVDELEK